jgi:hypothetical protein
LFCLGTHIPTRFQDVFHYTGIGEKAIRFFNFKQRFFLRFISFSKRHPCRNTLIETAISINHFHQLIIVGSLNAKNTKDATGAIRGGQIRWWCDEGNIAVIAASIDQLGKP